MHRRRAGSRGRARRRRRRNVESNALDLLRFDRLDTSAWLTFGDVPHAGEGRSFPGILSFPDQGRGELAVRRNLQAMGLFGSLELADHLARAEAPQLGRLPAVSDQETISIR